MDKNDLKAYEKLNDTAWAAPFESAAAMFERQARAHPNRIAAAETQRALTYAELNALANRVAHALMRMGIGQEELVMIFLPRNILYYAVNLGILKAGAAFVTASVSYPDERISYIYESAGCSAVITSREIPSERLESLRNLAQSPLYLEELLACEAAENPRIEISPRDLAYCIYTSGSTGKPKGVMIEQGNLSNSLLVNPKNHPSKSSSSSITMESPSKAFPLSTFRRAFPSGQITCSFIRRWITATRYLGKKWKRFGCLKLKRLRLPGK